MIGNRQSAIVNRSRLLKLINEFALPEIIADSRI